jgi:hypothetical protein
MPSRYTRTRTPSRRRRTRLPLTALILVLSIAAAVALWPKLFAHTSDPLSPGASNAGLREAGLVVSVEGVERIDADAARTLLSGIPSSDGSSGGARYDRDLFGQRWADLDRNGCDQRNDVLRRDLTTFVVQPGTQNCVVASGVLNDLYSGEDIRFVKGEQSSADVQIDHVVPLSWAWRHGAFAWSAEERERFANDFDNLLAVDGPTNTSKSDSGPAEWMPPRREFACEYVARFTVVLAEYDLGVDRADRSAIESALGTCP